MAKYLGAVQVAECPRCGEKVAAAALRPDGRIPSLRVCGACWDPPHEGERPYQPRTNEGKPRWPIAPELVPMPIASTLALSVTAEGVELTWSQFTSKAEMILRYEVHRSVNGGAAALLESIDVEYELWSNTLTYGSPYVAALPPAGTTYSYFVRGYDARGRSVDTASVTITASAISSWTNGDAETGDMTGWTITDGGHTSATLGGAPPEGSRCFYGGDNIALSKSYQRIDLLAEGASAPSIAAGNVWLGIEWWGGTRDNQTVPEEPQLNVLLRDSGTVLLDTYNSGYKQPDAVNTFGTFWFEEYNDVVPIPTDVQYADVEMESLRIGIENAVNHALFDDIRPTLYVRS